MNSTINLDYRQTHVLTTPLVSEQSHVELTNAWLLENMLSAANLLLRLRVEMPEMGDVQFLFALSRSTTSRFSGIRISTITLACTCQQHCRQASRVNRTVPSLKLVPAVFESRIGLTWYLTHHPLQL